MSHCENISYSLFTLTAVLQQGADRLMNETPQISFFVLFVPQF